MPTKLPDVNRLVAEVLTRVETEKTAQAKEETVSPTFTVPVAQGLQKLAQQLRSAAAVPVSFEDVHHFADNLMERAR